MSVEVQTTALSTQLIASRLADEKARANNIQRIATELALACVAAGLAVECLPRRCVVAANEIVEKSEAMARRPRVTHEVGEALKRGAVSADRAEEIIEVLEKECGL